MDIPHSIQIPTDGLFTDTILGCKLFQRLFTLYIVADNLSFIAPDTAIKTTAAVIAFIPLGTTSQAVPNHIFRPTEKAFFNQISNYLRKDNKINRLWGITPNVQPA